MKNQSNISRRKSDHLTINSTENVKSSNTTGLEKFRLIHCALPEIDYPAINTEIELFGKSLSMPFMISSMTGGTDQAFKINILLAEAAQEFGAAMGVGSQRIGIEQPEKMHSFEIRKYAPDILLLANLGAVQLGKSFSINDCKKAVDTIGANALILHLNPLQEALMVDGDSNFSGLLGKIENVCIKLDVPVIIKEVGWGISADIAKKLVSAGVSAIDVAGAGGTSWSEVERFRSSDPIAISVANGFRDWGIPTAEAIVEIRESLPDIPLIASGGLRDGVDIVKCLALGAQIGAIARLILIAAMKSESELDLLLTVLSRQIKTAMFAIGVSQINQISSNHIVRIN